MHSQKQSELKALTDESQADILRLKTEVEKKAKKVHMQKQFMNEMVQELTQAEQTLKTKIETKQKEFLAVLLAIFAKHFS